MKWSRLRNLNPDLFDSIASYYARTEGIKLGSARMLLAKNVKRIWEEVK